MSKLLVHFCRQLHESALYRTFRDPKTALGLLRPWPITSTCCHGLLWRLGAIRTRLRLKALEATRAFLYSEAGHRRSCKCTEAATKESCLDGEQLSMCAETSSLYLFVANPLGTLTWQSLRHSRSVLLELMPGALLSTSLVVKTSRVNRLTRYHFRTLTSNA